MSEATMPDRLTWIRTRWLPALRSGEYAQTTRMLRHGNAYCCLGVACDVAMHDGMLAGSWRMDGQRFTVAASEEVQPFELPTTLADALGIGRRGERVPRHQDPYLSLSDANDSGFTFVEIADAIERWCGEQERGAEGGITR